MSNKSVKMNIGGKHDSLPIKEFSFEMFASNPSIIIIAKRASGKSWLVRALLEHFKKVPVGIIICPTDSESNFYGSFFPETYIYYEFDSDLFLKIFDRQKSLIKLEKEKLAKGKKFDPSCMIVMDDCLADKGKWAKDETIRKLLMNGRHYRITYILTMQYALGITPELRSNFDYIFLLAEDFVCNLKRIYEHYAGMFPTFDSFRQIFTQLTDDYGAMVISNRGVKKSFLEKIFWYKAPDLEGVKFDFGCRQFKEFHEKNYNEHWNDNDKSNDINEMIARKKRDKRPIAISKMKQDYQQKPIIQKMTEKYKRTESDY